MSEKLLTAKEAAEILKVRKNTVYDMIKRGDLKASKLGKQLRIRQGDLEFYIQYGSQAKVYQEGNSEQKNNIEKVEFERNTQNRTEKNVMANPGFGQAGMCDQIIICGQDMVLDLLANRLNQCIGENVFRSYKGSYNALYAMYQGEVNVATAHLWHGKTNSYNIPYISSMLPGTDLVVYTAAIHPDNPEFAAAKAAGVPMLTRAELLGQIMRNYDTPIAVSGTHGKTTTTSMISQILLEADADPTISVGGILPSIGGNIRVCLLYTSPSPRD